MAQASPAEHEAVRQRLLSIWQTRLIDLVEEDPTAAETLRSLRDELRSRLPVAQQQWVQTITSSASGATAQGVMFGNIINHPDRNADQPTGEARP